MASPIVITMPNSFCAPLNSARSSGTDWSTWITFEPASSCMMRPDVTIGLMPSSMSVPLQ
jgi:hypothetical protein